MDDLPKRRILLVQPDRQRVEALQNVIQPKQNQWDLRYETDFTAAEELLLAEPWDIVIGDLESDKDRAFFNTVRESSPQVIRFALTGQARSNLPSASMVHQFLFRPVVLDEFAVAVERSCRFRDLLYGKDLADTVGKLGGIPAAPTVYLRLVERLDHPDASIEEIAELVEADPAISANLLRLVNSAMFRTSREIATVSLAASYLGLSGIKNLVMSSAIFTFFEKGQKKIPDFSIDKLQVHSRLTADIAAKLPLSKDERDTAVVAALLHDVGKLVLAWKMPDRLISLLQAARETHLPLYQVEEERWGLTHAEIGAYLLSLWGLPSPVTQAIAYHHSPARVPSYRLDALGAVYIANLLAHEQDQNHNATPGPWDHQFLDGLGLGSQLSRWKELAEGAAMRQQDRRPAELSRR